MAVYVDTSALVRLVVAEAGTAELLDYLAGRPDRFTSVIGSIELRRAVARRDPSLRDRAAAVVAAIATIDLSPSIVEGAATIDPALLRTLDAIHLVSAMAVGPELEAFVTYDDRQAEAAHAAGLTVIAPG